MDNITIPLTAPKEILVDGPMPPGTVLLLEWPLTHARFRRFGGEEERLVIYEEFSHTPSRWLAIYNAKTGELKGRVDARLIVCVVDADAPTGTGGL